MSTNTNTAEARYNVLKTAREPFLNRARDCSALTIPSLIPPDGHSGHTLLPTPYQGIGARGLNTLASKMLLALLPPNSPFFRLNMDDFVIEALAGKEGQRAEVDKALNKIERSVMSKIEAEAYRVDAFEAFKHLIVGGNVLLYVNPEGGLKVFHLDSYVVRRDKSGNVLEIVAREGLDPQTVADEVMGTAPSTPVGTDVVNLYTHIIRHGKFWKVYQEVNGAVVPGSSGKYALDSSPWIPMRFSKVSGEDYGRGYIEEYLGDLKSLEALQKAIVQGSAAAAKVVFFVSPNGVTKQRDVANSENLDVKTGHASDISTLQVDKFADFRVAQEAANGIVQRLAGAFLMNGSIQRAGERVTAEEIRVMAGELEDALGGVYSIMAQEFQTPLVSRLIDQMERAGSLPKLPKGYVKPTITTGMEALGRGHDVSKLRTFAGIAAEAASLPPELNRGDYLTRIGTALGIDMAGLVKTPEEIAAEQQREAMSQLIQTLGPKAMEMMNQQGAQDGPQAEAAA